MTASPLPTTEQIRGRMKLAREIEFNAGREVTFASESEQRLFHLANRLHGALVAALDDLDLYVGYEPTLTEEALYVHEQEVRAKVAAEVHRAGMPKFADGENPELVVQVTRAIDVRLITDQHASDYWVPEGGAS